MASQHGAPLTCRVDLPIHSKQPEAFRWDTLPGDVRILIFEAITTCKFPGWGSCAAVCKEWQSFIEKKNFSHLELGASCLNDLDSMTERSRMLIRCVRLDIALPRYTCQDCQWLESAPTASHNRSILNEDIQRLFLILSSWRSTHGIALDLNVYCPSDWQHWFKNFHFREGHNDRGRTTSTTDEPGQRDDGNWHDPKHGWIDGQQVEVPQASAVLRLFGLLDMRHQVALPKVCAVTRFSIRRQMRRWLMPSAIQLILQSLPCIEEIVYEPWLPCVSKWRAYGNSELTTMIPTFPKSLKRLSIFQDYNDVVCQALTRDWRFPHWNENPPPNSSLAKAFALRSVELEDVSLSYITDTLTFFQEAPARCMWHRLRSLALTARALQPKVVFSEASETLRLASEAALRMPELQIMALWHAKRNQACAFLYHKDKNGDAHITWRGTWDLDFNLDPKIVKCWTRVAHKFTARGGLQVNKERLFDGEAIYSHGHAIPQLGLPQSVIDSVSLWQIQSEARLSKEDWELRLPKSSHGADLAQPMNVHAF